MDSTNKRAPGARGAGGAAVCWNGRHYITAATYQQLFGFAVLADRPGGRR